MSKFRELVENMIIESGILPHSEVVTHTLNKNGVPAVLKHTNERNDVSSHPLSGGMGHTHATPWKQSAAGTEHKVVIHSSQENVGGVMKNKFSVHKEFGTGTRTASRHFDNLHDAVKHAANLHAGISNSNATHGSLELYSNHKTIGGSDRVIEN